MRPGPIRPGDWHSVVEPLNALRGFNEARADSPGRFRIGQPTVTKHPRASMRPGPIRPGDSPDILRFAAQNFVLQ